MKKIIFVVLLLSGCTSLLPQSTQKIADYIDGYCLTTDAAMRAAMRSEINNLTNVGDIEISCD